MYIVGDIFKLSGKEYRLRHINQFNACCLEPVLYRDKFRCITGGKNEIVLYDDLQNIEYMELCY